MHVVLVHNLFKKAIYSGTQTDPMNTSSNQANYRLLPVPVEVNQAIIEPYVTRSSR